MTLPIRYTGRFVLADGTPRCFSVWAFNKADAAAMVERAAREELGEAFRSALSYGVERQSRRVLIVAADGEGRPRRVLRQLTTGGAICG